MKKITMSARELVKFNALLAEEATELMYPIFNITREISYTEMLITAGQATEYDLDVLEVLKETLKEEALTILNDDTLESYALAVLDTHFNTELEDYENVDAIETRIQFFVSELLNAVEAIVEAYVVVDEETIEEQAEEVYYAPEATLMISEDVNNNEVVINNFIEKAIELKATIMSKSNNEIHEKLLNKCINKFEALRNKTSMYPDKLANKVAKVLDTTVCKLLSISECKEDVLNFVKACGVKVLDWEIGRKLSDADFEYIDENILTEGVNDPELDDTLVKVNQEGLIVEYIEDGEVYEVIIGAVCTIGIF